MTMRLFALLFFCTGIVMATKDTIEDLNRDMPYNFQEIMPSDLIQCSQLAAEKKFDDGILVLKQADKNSDTKAQIYSQIYLDLQEVYTSAKEYFETQRDTLDDNITKKNFIYNQLLRYFWWSHYYPVYEGLIDDIDDSSE
jgi:hypothetical protein